MRFEDQGAHGASLVRGLFLFGQEDGRFLRSSERCIMDVWGPTIQIVGRQGGGKIQTRAPRATSRWLVRPRYCCLRCPSRRARYASDCLSRTETLDSNGWTANAHSCSSAALSFMWRAKTHSHRVRRVDRPSRVWVGNLECLARSHEARVDWYHARCIPNADWNPRYNPGSLSESTTPSWAPRPHRWPLWWCWAVRHAPCRCYWSSVPLRSRAAPSPISHTNARPGNSKNRSPCRPRRRWPSKCWMMARMKCSPSTTGSKWSMSSIWTVVRLFVLFPSRCTYHLRENRYCCLGTNR